MLPDLLHVLCGADCQFLNSLFQMFAADAESAERSQSVVCQRKLRLVSLQSLSTQYSSLPRALAREFNIRDVPADCSVSCLAPDCISQARLQAYALCSHAHT